MEGKKWAIDWLSVCLCVSRYPPVAARCNEKKREIMIKLEAKIETGIERLALALQCSYTFIP